MCLCVDIFYDYRLPDVTSPYDLDYFLPQLNLAIEFQVFKVTF
jgi:hypothetical protein